MEQTIKITEIEKWFIKCAINLKDAVLPLHPDSLDAKIFKQDFGYSKKEVEKAIKSLKDKLNQP